MSKRKSKLGESSKQVASPFGATSPEASKASEAQISTTPGEEVPKSVNEGFKTQTSQ